MKYQVKVDKYGNRIWKVNGKRHRVDGPAVEGTDGSKYWYLNGKKLTEAEFKRILVMEK